MNKYIIQAAIQQAVIGSNVNLLPPENAIRFEGSDEPIFFENDETEEYIFFETI